MPSYSLGDIQLVLPDALLTPLIQRMLEKGWYEVEEAKALRAHLRDDDRVLELGGGAGFLATLCALKVGAQNVATVEANPTMLPIIRENLERNGQGGADVLHGAVLSSSGLATTDFYIPEAFWAATLEQSGKGAVRQVSVPVWPLSDLLQRYAPTVLIVDVEGAEKDYFEGMLPSGLRLIVIELHPDAYARDIIGVLFARLAAQGFIYQPKGSQGAVVVFERL
ncbi:FkbM family methyltransferase [Pararhodobacter sp. CCB-MM2]|uniref:FkbM family methyltransferase n=1 Tax=Pararhodobacter sp. CCB-MM2 TaxID=1786003 RepID=UPI00083540E2|nr:FkbM family methyltransferase [Pararhodobacter sp. CCB-MM2]